MKGYITSICISSTFRYFTTIFLGWLLISVTGFISCHAQMAELVWFRWDYWDIRYFPLLRHHRDIDPPLRTRSVILRPEIRIRGAVECLAGTQQGRGFGNDCKWGIDWFWEAAAHFQSLWIPKGNQEKLSRTLYRVLDNFSWLPLLFYFMQPSRNIIPLHSLNITPRDGRSTFDLYLYEIIHIIAAGEYLSSVRRQSQSSIN